MQKLARFFDETALLLVECNNDKLSRAMKKPDFCLCKGKVADQLHLCFCYTNSSFSLLLTLYIQNFKFPAFFYEFTARFVSDLVGNPEERFSRIGAQLAVFLETVVLDQLLHYV